MGEWWRSGGCWVVRAGAALLWAGLALPAQAHGLLGEDDPAYLGESLLLDVGTPLLVLVVGAMIGVGLATWSARQPDGGGGDDGVNRDVPVSAATHGQTADQIDRRDVIGR